MDTDKGVLFVVEHADSPVAKAFIKIVKKVEAYLKEIKESKTASK